VVDFPAVVTIDSHGGSLHKQILAESQAELAKHL
jgi:tartrate dehydratase beta subunit/fumarate hydratase class I family protein